MYQGTHKIISELFPVSFQTDKNHTILSEKHNYLLPLGFRMISETGKFWKLFGNDTEKLLEEINEELAA